MENSKEIEDINIAVIGSGYWGKNLVRNFNDLGVLKLICDTNETTLADFRTKYPAVETCLALTDVLSRNDIQGIVIATPAETHYSIAREALLAGKNVYVEKPLVLVEEEGEELIELAKEKNLVLMVGHLLQYHPVFTKLKTLVCTGELGRINYIYSNRLNLGKIRREENALWSFAPHDISMILTLAGEEPDSVFATGGNYLHKKIADVTTTHLEFPSGTRAHIHVSWLHPFKEQKLVVVGDKKMAVFDDTLPWEDKLQLYAHEINWENNIPVPDKADPERPSIEQDEPLRLECKHFLSSIESNTVPLTNGNEGLRVLRVLNAAQKSLDEPLQHRNEQTFAASNPPSTIGEQEFFAHETAVVDAETEIGKDTKVWHFSHILSGAKIGEKCSFGQNVSVSGGVTIGDNVKVQNNVSIYEGTTIEDDVFLGPSCVLTNVTNPRSQVVRRSLYEKTLIKRGATIGANATIVCGTTIGRYAFIAAGATVTKSVPDYGLMMGAPAVQKGWMSRHGHKLNNPNAEGIMKCPESRLKYKEVEPGLLKCLDLEEGMPLPYNMAVGKIAYNEFK